MPRIQPYCLISSSGMERTPLTVLPAIVQMAIAPSLPRFATFHRVDNPLEWTSPKPVDADALGFRPQSDALKDDERVTS